MVDDYSNISAATIAGAGDDLSQYWTAALVKSASEKSIVRDAFPESIKIPKQSGVTYQVPYQKEMVATEYSLDSIVLEFEKEQIKYNLNTGRLMRWGISSLWNKIKLDSTPIPIAKETLVEQQNAVIRRENQLLATAVNAVIGSTTYAWNYDVSGTTLTWDDVVKAARELKKAKHYNNSKYPYILLVNQNEADDLVADSDLVNLEHAWHADANDMKWGEPEGCMLYDLKRPLRVKVYEMPTDSPLDTNYAALIDPWRGARFVELSGHEGIRTTTENPAKDATLITTETMLAISMLSKVATPATEGDYPGVVSIDLTT